MRRRLIYCADFHTHSVVLLFERGGSGESWSVRDYSESGSVITRYAREFDLPLAELNKRVTASFDAPVVSTDDLAFWHKRTLACNRELSLESGLVSHATEQAAQPVAAQTNGFVLLNRDRLMAMPKSRKANDLSRMVESPRSEDWVTWSVFALLERYAPATWWNHFVALAMDANDQVKLPSGWQGSPQVLLWQQVSAPAAYELASRERMRSDGSKRYTKRLANARPVEGESEIDIILRNEVLTLFVEAKLGSDVSLDTSYDPERNQIVRNIDCLLEESGGTVPMFWMLVRDVGRGRAYTQLLERYRSKPESLSDYLPHRDSKDMHRVAQNLSVILWKDLLEVLPHASLMEEESRTVFEELRRRVR